MLDPEDVPMGAPKTSPLTDAEEAVLRLAGTAPTTPRPVDSAQRRAVDGETFVTSVSDHVPAAWGKDGRVLWAEGEPLMLVGPDGVGKTSLGQQLTLGRLGLRSALLDLPVAPARGRVLYVAADRPRQAASSLRRMIDEDDHPALRERLLVWKGPLPFDLTEDPAYLADFLGSFENVSDCVIDSLKDVAVDLAKDETGGRVSVAFQEVIARGYELAVLHHQRKEQQGAGKPRRLADVYGSRWLTAGMGSVALLWGEPGDLAVEFRHLKQPVEEVGPFQVVHDHDRGSSTVADQVDLFQALGRAQKGLTVADAAGLLFQTVDPTRNEIEKARRKLNALTDSDHATREDDPDGTARYFLLANHA